MTLDRLSGAAVQKVSGPAWREMKAAFLAISDALLRASPDATGNLTTIYVKYQVHAEQRTRVFAVVWLKTSKRITVGLALPDDFDSPLLGPAPAGMAYKGMSRYFAVEPGNEVPLDLAEWARAAYLHAATAAD